MTICEMIVQRNNKKMIRKNKFKFLKMEGRIIKMKKNVISEKTLRLDKAECKLVNWHVLA